MKTQFDETQKLLTALRIEHNGLQTATKDKDAKINHLEKKLAKITETRDGEKRARKETDRSLLQIRQENQALVNELDSVKQVRRWSPDRGYRNALISLKKSRIAKNM